MKHTDVVIVGAGPVGLLLALELERAGASCVVLEAREQQEEVQKALSVGPLGAEALMRQGMGPELDALEARSQALMAPFLSGSGGGWRRSGKEGRRFAGHFAGIPLLSQEQDRQRPTRLIDQRHLQSALRDEVERRGIMLRRPCRVTGLEEGQEALILTFTREDGQVERIACRYAVGCDGARSTLRKLGGFAFPGTDPTLGFYQVFVAFDEAHAVRPAGWQMQPGGVMAYGPIPERLFLVDYSGPPPEGQTIPTQMQVEAAIQRVCGRAMKFSAYRGGRCWTDHTRLVDQYRQGRIFLAGDAAHIHPPFGGQGLGLGLVDAANLGWKLGAVLSGRMPETLLDSYEQERRPVARDVLDNTRAQTALMRPDPQSRALHALMAEMLSRDEPCATLGARMRGYTMHYDTIAHSADCPALGTLPGDQVLPDGRSVFALMQQGAGVLLVPDQARHAFQGLTIPGNLVLASWHEAFVSLLRPDGCLVWQGAPRERASLNTALVRWFGASLDA